MTQKIAGLIALVLIDALRVGRETLPPGTEHSFEPAEAERLVRIGAAHVPGAAPATPTPPGGREIVKEVIKEVIVEKTDLVKALSEEGGKFLRFKKPESAADFALEQKDMAVIAELQALEYRREGGPRAEVLQALGMALDAIAEPPAPSSE